MAKETRWSAAYTAKDNAIHPSDTPGHWEWWYFDADFDDGYKMIGTFHFGSPRPPAYPDARFIEIGLYDPSGNKRLVRKRFNMDECSAATETCDVVMGPNIFKDVKGDLTTFHLSFHDGKNENGCDITYETMVESWQKKELFAGKTGWMVVTSRAKVTGIMTWDGKKRAVKGIGYHDHNWGDFVLGETADTTGDAIWPRIHMGDWMLNGGAGRSSRRTGYIPFGDLICWKKDKVVVYSNKGGGIGSDYTSEGTGIAHPRAYKVWYNDPGILEGEINFKVTNMFEFMDLHSRYKPFQKWYTEIFDRYAAYFRFSLDYAVDLKIAGEKVTGRGKNWCEYHLF